MIRLRIFVALLGFLLALAGIYLDSRPLIWTSMVVLSVTLALRYWSRRGEKPPTHD